MDEGKWVKKAQKGDSTAFEQLVLANQNQIYRLCFHMVGNADDAEDMVQETFLKAWRNLEGFQGDSSFSTWLYRLASNCCLDFLRSQKRRPTVSMTTEDEEGEEQTIEVADNSATPEEELLLKEEQSEIAQAMASLDEEQRQILTLRVVNDLSYTEIGEMLSLKEGTVKSRLARARENLRKKLLQIRNKSVSPSSNRQIGGHHEL